MTASSAGNVSTPFVKKISRAKMADRRLKGLCYNCNEPYTFGHQCRKLFWLELEDVGELNEELGDKTIQEPDISLHAIMGFQHSRTMQLLADIKGCPITMLVDSGNIHNFISKIAAQ